MKSLLISILQFFAKRILRKYKPIVVGITGSVGKTSTKEAIFAVLASKFSVLASPKNYNNELGVPLTIIGARAPGSSPLKWCVVFSRALWIWIIPRRYPAIVVLEMGADRPKDIVKLVAFAPPSVGVVTAVAPVHTEFFGSLKRVAVEKRRLVEAVPKEGTVILNFDDAIVRGFADYADGKIMSYGIEEKGSVQGVEIVEYLGSDTFGEIGGVHFKILHDGSAVPIHLHNVLGRQHVYAALAGAAVGRVFQMNMVEISNALLKYAPPPGRMRLISGVKGTVLIDDTYNSSARAAAAALASLGHLSLKEGAQRYAILADMFELGNLTEELHREVGRVAGKEADIVIAVGVSAAWIAEEAIKSGMSSDRVFHFHTLDEGVEHFLQQRIKPGDVLLIKGSQGMRMERLVKGLMAQPLQAKNLLCRQEKEWE
ncbi:MAG: UDP-N-acetylmuramoyl-tripeptide--D-alanyl-D-alanine ligase [bacterium]|nr:UDP-N-acetylmuramoyl-tripeptide--D-alanyl-D-alanine ligase [bacterium]